MRNFFKSSFWERGFRPFFLFGAFYSAISIALWVLQMSGIYAVPAIFGDPVLWHGHEMIHGFGMAIVAGFLLTAVANWTGWSPVREAHLALLAGLWLAGRIAMNVAGLPFWLVIVLENAFIPALALSLSVPLLKSWNARNFVFLGLLGLLFLCDVFYLVLQTRMPLYVSLLTIVMMISLIGGRIIPSFTVAALRMVRAGDIRIHDQPFMDRAAFISLAALAVIMIVEVQPALWTALAATIAGGIHLVRMTRYHTAKTLKFPMLWILHAGYGWLVIGLFLIAVSGLGIGTFPAALHALTVGAIGSMTIGMMARVTLGHTGRNLIAGRLTVLAFILMQVTAVIRVFGPVLAPGHYLLWIIGSGILWVACFTLYMGVYIPMLLKPNVNSAGSG